MRLADNRKQIIFLSHSRDFKKTLADLRFLCQEDLQIIMIEVNHENTFISGAPSGRSRRLPLITRPPASYGANPR